MIAMVIFSFAHKASHYFLKFMNYKLEKKERKIAEPSDFCTALDDDKVGFSSSSANNLLSSVKNLFFSQKNGF